MVFVPPPQIAHGRPTYAETYNKILTTHRQSPLTSASSVIILVAPNVDALCASRMLADLFKQDDVIYRIVPVAGLAEIENLKEELRLYAELHSLILLNMGGFMDLPSADWFGDFDPRVTVHVIDSTRPQSLANLFGGGANGERVIVWDDGEADKLTEEGKAWELTQYELPEDDDEEDENQSSEDDNEQNQSDEEGHKNTKRKSTSHDGNSPRKRPRTDEQNAHRLSRDERQQLVHRIDKHYSSGTWYGQSASATIYILATVLERVDNDFLWLAILGLTYQYVTSRISREYYDSYHAIYNDEVSRLNPISTDPDAHSLITLNPDDVSVRATEELRFMLFRHWTLYDAMYHSSYVASKLGIWKERGRKRLTGLLAKMGFSMLQTQQPYAHMDMDLKKMLIQKLNDMAPEYGLVELSYPSFIRCFGYHSQPLSAADAVEGISALLDVAGGVRMEVEVEGARNGGEWFGGGRVWEANIHNDSQRKHDGKRNDSLLARAAEPAAGTNKEDEQDESQNKKEVDWWVRNFWTAYDSLNDIKRLQDALSLSMSLHRAIIRQGTSIIDKQDIRTMRNHRVVVLTQGPDLVLFSHPGVLSRLALWLVDALRDRVAPTNPNARSKRRSLPFVVACLNEQADKYIVVGVMAALDFGDVRKNEFGATFLEARERCGAATSFGTFDTNVIEIEQKDLKGFLDALCEGPEGY